jgi:rod shape-determining protein MreD
LRRLILSVVLVAVALAAQLTIVNRLSLPGGAGPDLVLLVVVALALTGGPLPGVLTGFLAGLALDVAPPAGHTVGEYALVFCIVGYVCGRLAGLGEESPALLYVAISAGAAAVGAVLYAGLGVMLSDPEVTWASVQHVLPPAVVYNALLSPFVLFGVAKLNGWISSSDAVVGPSAAMSSAATSALGGAGLAGGAVRQASASGSPKLHLGDHRGGDAWIAGARSASAGRPAGLATSQREPRLRLSGQRSSGGSASGLGTSTARYSAPKIAPKMNFRGARSSFGGGSGANGSLPHSGAKPKFRKRTTTSTIGASSALSRATPRRGTFGRSRSFGKGASLGRRSALSGRRVPRGSAPRLKMRRHAWRTRLGRLLGRNRNRNRGGFR